MNKRVVLINALIGAVLTAVVSASSILAWHGNVSSQADCEGWSLDISASPSDQAHWNATPGESGDWSQSDEVNWEVDFWWENDDDTDHKQGTVKKPEDCELPEPTPTPTQEPTPTPTPTQVPTPTPTPEEEKEEPVCSLSAEKLNDGGWYRLHLRWDNAYDDWHVLYFGDGADAWYKGTSGDPHPEHDYPKGTHKAKFYVDGPGGSVTCETEIKIDGDGLCTDEKPTQAPNLSGFRSSSTSVVLTWNSVEPLSHYTIRYGKSSGNYIYGATDIGKVNIYEVKDLEPNVKYYFQVAGVNGCRVGDWSNEISPRERVLGTTTELVKHEPVAAGISGSSVVPLAGALSAAGAVFFLVSKFTRRNYLLDK